MFHIYIKIRCQSSVEIARPRCGHGLSLRCHTAQKLKEDWEKQNSESAFDRKYRIDQYVCFFWHVVIRNVFTFFTLPEENSSTKNLVIIHGKKYGPSESTLDPSISNCLVLSTYSAPCGHRTQQPCPRAFDYASDKLPPPECSNPTLFTCSVCCNSAHQIPCWLAKTLSTWHLWTDEQHMPIKQNNNNSPNGLIRVTEAAIINRYIKLIFDLCIHICKKKVP